MKIIKLLFSLTVLLASSLAESAIITNASGTYSHDTNTDIVVGNGLEWLQWDRTVGLSWNDANAILGTIEGGGWAIATNVQMASLFNSFDFGMTFDSDENTSEEANTGFELGSEVGDDLAFLNMFGDTGLTTIDCLECGEGGFHVSAALFGQDVDEDGLINRAFVYDDYYEYWSGYPVPGKASIDYDSLPKGYQLEYAGIALVRAAVPAPSTIALLGIGFAGLGIARCRKQQA